MHCWSEVGSGERHPSLQFAPSLPRSQPKHLGFVAPRKTRQLVQPSLNTLYIFATDGGSQTHPPPVKTTSARETHKFFFWKICH